MNLSHLDRKYFIDQHVYNCPFCKRNNVSYEMQGGVVFDWSEDKQCYGYVVRCGSAECGKRSMHLSYEKLWEYSTYSRRWYFESIYEGDEIDSHIFFSQPTSHFVLDSRIPRRIRDLIYEAEQSQRSNFLVGASACLRKAIYELLEHEKAIAENPKTGRADYQESVKTLKAKYSFVSSELFDALGNIQQMASDNVHEGSWQSWDSRKIKFIIELTKSILHEMYVLPAERKKTLGTLAEMQTELSNSKNTPSKSQEP